MGSRRSSADLTASARLEVCSGKLVQGLIQIASEPVEVLPRHVKIALLDVADSTICCGGIQCPVWQGFVHAGYTTNGLCGWAARLATSLNPLCRFHGWAGNSDARQQPEKFPPAGVLRAPCSSRISNAAYCFINPFFFSARRRGVRSTSLDA